MPLFPKKNILTYISIESYSIFSLLYIWLVCVVSIWYILYNFSKPISNQNQPPDMDEYKLPRYPHSRPQPYLGLEDSLQQRFSNYPEMKAKGFNPLQNGDDPMYNNDDLIRASIINQLPPKIG